MSSTMAPGRIAFVASATLVTVAGCSAGRLGDWRQAGIKGAEQRMRATLGDPGAKFSEEQLTGDQRTGQTCGRVVTSAGASGRFIVYIDTPEPYLESGLGERAVSQEDFDQAWENDCLHEGYNVAPGAG